MDLTVSNYEIALSGTPIVRDVSLRVADGQFVGLLGPNGCGKSTLLRGIYKALRPRGGKAMLGELDLVRCSAREAARKMSTVTQFSPVGFDLSVREFVMTGRTPHKGWIERDTSADIRIVEHALALVDMSGFADRGYDTLSGGEKQRVILARAIAQEPAFLVLDEPTNHLDIKHQLGILSAVRALGIGVLAAMHDLNLAAMYCDYIYLMQHGRIFAGGSPRAVLTEENIREVFEVSCTVRSDEAGGTPQISFLA